MPKPKKYLRILITATPFLIPWFLLLVEEMSGKGQGVVWSVILYVAYAAFVLSLVQEELFSLSSIRYMFPAFFLTIHSSAAFCIGITILLMVSHSIRIYALDFAGLSYVIQLFAL